ncbi:hypothetical protein QBC35DRAFT_503630 [Podospora australis]|uniref:Uncharacterized protein n=1 Tax=Podospora australis TaxID=1536484 RepID=A0AAN6WQ61_9PEZI|nr:hypothetical protein QBC35DRAFT_503630 [Podospora australis]
MEVFSLSSLTLVVTKRLLVMLGSVLFLSKHGQGIWRTRVSYLDLLLITTELCWDHSLFISVIAFVSNLPMVIGCVVYSHRHHYTDLAAS